MAQNLISKPVVEREISNLQKRVLQLSTKPRLKVVLIGENPSSKIYVKRKKEFCEKIGAICEVIEKDKSFTPNELTELLKNVNEDPDTHGCLVQLPLPEQFNNFDFQHIIHPSKDVDGFHQKNIFSVYQNKSGNFLLPCTPIGIVELLNFYKIKIPGKKVCIIGRSLIVGKPLSMILSNLDATVTLCHSKTTKLRDITRESDIIVSAIGKPNYLDETYFRNDKSQVVIDVGISKMKNNKISGDVDFKNVQNIVSSITPVPGGVGPMTILSLAKNLVKAAELIQNKP